MRTTRPPEGSDPEPPQRHNFGGDICTIPLCMTADLVRALNAESKRRRLSRSALCRELLSAGLQQAAQRVS